MIPYFLLLLIPALLCFVMEEKRPGERRLFLVGRTQRVRENNLGLPCFFLMLLLLLMCRGDTVGIDLKNYRYIFERTGQRHFSDLLAHPAEGLFFLFTYGMYHLTRNYQIYLAAAACIELIPIWAYYQQDRRHSLVQMILFVNMSTFVMLFSGLRQSMAIALGVWVFDCIRRNKLLPAVILTGAAMLFHTSAFMIVLLYPIYHVRLKRRHLWIVISAVAMLFLFNRQVFGLLTGILSRYGDRFEARITSTGAFGSLLLFAVLLLFAYLISDEAQMDEETFALRNLLIAAAMVQCFAPLHSLAMRMNYYFIILIPAAMGKIFSVPKKRYHLIAKWGEAVLCWFFGWYFCYGIYRSCVTGVSALNTVPYIPFWAS